MKDAIAHGLQAPEKEIVRLELKLNRQFLLQNAEARDLEPRILESGTTSESGETSSESGDDEDSLVVHIDVINSVRTVKCRNPKPNPVEIEEARREEEFKAKRLRVDAKRRVCELAGGEGNFKDVEGEWNISLGEWSISCPKTSTYFHSRDYRSSFGGTDLTMSIFFVNNPELDKNNETGKSLTMCANFKMGLLGGMLRTSSEIPLSTSFPEANIRCSWRGRDAGTGAIQHGDRNTGILAFISKTQMRGELKSPYGQYYFYGSKVEMVPVDKKDIWEDLSKSQHGQEEKPTLGDCYFDLNSLLGVGQQQRDAFGIDLQEERKAKRRKIEESHKATCEACGKGSFKDVEDIPFTWRGRETDEGEIQLDEEGDTNLGSLTFLSKTEVKGMLKSTYGNFPFYGTKLGEVPVDKEDVWEELSESQHRREEGSRLGGDSSSEGWGGYSSSDECDYVDVL